MHWSWVEKEGGLGRRLRDEDVAANKVRMENEMWKGKLGL